MCTLSIVDQEQSVDGDDDSKSTCVTIISKTGGGRKDEESKQKTKSYRILSPIFIILTVIMTTLVAILVLCIAVCLCVTPVDDEASMQTNHTEVPKSKENDDTKSSVSLLEYNRLMNQVVKLNATVKRLERQIELKSNQTEAKKLGIRDSWVEAILQYGAPAFASWQGCYLYYKHYGQTARDDYCKENCTRFCPLPKECNDEL